MGEVCLFLEEFDTELVQNHDSRLVDFITFLPGDGLKQRAIDQVAGELHPFVGGYGADGSDRQGARPVARHHFQAS